MLFFLVALLQLLVKAELLYDLSFLSDKFSDGAILVSDDTIHTPSSLNGSIEIAHGYDGQEGNWAKLGTNGACKIQGDIMNFQTSSRTISLELDIYYGGGSSRFNIQMEPGVVVRVYDMKLVLFDVGLFTFETELGEMKERTRHHLEVFISWEINLLYVTLDGKNVSSGELYDDSFNVYDYYEDDVIDIVKLEFTHTEIQEPCDDIVAVSNIKISDDSLEQPEPEVGMLQPSIKITKRNEIPAEGGRIRYDAAIKSTYAKSDKDFIFYLTITLTSGLQIPVKRRHSKTLAASKVFDASRVAKIAGWVPAGSYQLTLVVINAENGDITTATSAFVKL